MSLPSSIKVIVSLLLCIGVLAAIANQPEITIWAFGLAAALMLMTAMFVLVVQVLVEYEELVAEGGRDE